MTKQIQVQENLRAPFNYINTVFAHHLPYYIRIISSIKFNKSQQGKLWAYILLLIYLYP